jgi:hypothetical protein
VRLTCVPGAAEDPGGGAASEVLAANVTATKAARLLWRSDTDVGSVTIPVAMSAPPSSATAAACPMCCRMDAFAAGSADDVPKLRVTAARCCRAL